jgi:malate synthase
MPLPPPLESIVQHGHEAERARRGTDHDRLRIAPPPGSEPARVDEVLTPVALGLVTMLHDRFEGRRQDLLAARGERQLRLAAGEKPDFLAATAAVRAADWQVVAPPADLVDRRVEITGPVDRKMIVNALNSGAQCYMADFEDSTAPTWENVVGGQVNLLDANHRRIDFTDPQSGKAYRLNERIATLIVRPRGWHLPEKHVVVDGRPVAGALFDFAVYLANNHAALAARGSGPYFYLPKLESHLEARLWNDVFVAAQEYLDIPRGTIRATVLIETILAAFEMDEILYELREHSAGLNCGRWDYIFSFIKKFRDDPACLLPDRSSISMERPFLAAYVALLIRTCHRRGAHAMGGMAAQIPIRDDAAANTRAVEKVRADKLREARAGHDGTWVAHPGLVATAREAFESVLGTAPNQLNRQRDDVRVTAADLLAVPDGAITDDGLRHNLRVGVQYLEAWLRGAGCVPLYNLMEDAATAEISRAQLWQWRRHGARLADGGTVTATLIAERLASELERIAAEVGPDRFAAGRYAEAAALFARMVTADRCDDFLTLPAYELLP